MSEEIDEDQLDPGIADVVTMLRNLNFKPTDSGDGRSKPDDARDFDRKHVACTVAPQADEEPKEHCVRFHAEARRLANVLGSGWMIEATYQPFGDSFILLATKNETPAPRHAAALAGWPFELRDYSKQFGPDSAIEKMFAAGCALHKALIHELERR